MSVIHILFLFLIILAILWAIGPVGNPFGGAECDTAHTVVGGRDSDAAIDVKDDRLAAFYKQNNITAPALVWHFATWCGACTMFEGEWKKISGALKSKKLKLVKMDADIQSTPSIVRLPTVVYYDPARGAFKFTGNKTSENIVAWVNSHMK